MNSNYDWSKNGYNLEELYFEKLNQELIKRLKMVSKKTTPPPLELRAEVIAFPTGRRNDKNEKKAA